jgi:hypothetical protein
LRLTGNPQVNLSDFSGLTDRSGGRSPPSRGLTHISGNEVLVRTKQSWIVLVEGATDHIYGGLVDPHRRSVEIGLFPTQAGDFTALPAGKCKMARMPITVSAMSRRIFRACQDDLTHRLTGRHAYHSTISSA